VKLDVDFMLICTSANEVWNWGRLLYNSY